MYKATKLLPVNMKLQKRKLIFLFFATAFAGCAKKVHVECGTPELINMPSIESKVLSLRTIGIADTTAALISGLVLSKDSADKKVIIDTLAFTLVSFINRETSDSVSAVAGKDGTFRKYLMAGSYDIQFGMIGYNRLRIENVSFGSGELKELDVLLGHGNSRPKVLKIKSFQ